jgi:hypothetical protein
MTLGTIAAGALEELFGAELSKVLATIQDVNTDPKAKREIGIKLTFAPSEDREMTEVKVACNSKLAGLLTVKTRAFLGRQDGRLVAVEHDPKQSGLFDDGSKPKVTAIRGGKAE